ncbi:tetratricopeptide repeat protein [Vibrio makurazakiensis]|uniref:tetratricopeptide repeat protein n=1 Tax=Vibrio makurazakiensis TaxID=2910250 RepID=UPI003D11D769
MSAINSALSDLAKKKSNNNIEAAIIPAVKTRSPIIWLAGGFTLSLAVGGWAVNQSAPKSIISESEIVQVRSQVDVLPVPTNKITPQVTVTVQAEPLATVMAQNNSSQLIDAGSSQIETLAVKAADKKVEKVATTLDSSVKVSRSVQKVPEPVLVASSHVSNSQIATGQTKIKSEQVLVETEMMIQQVELTPEQLSENAQGRAQKALDSNDLLGALSNLTEALRYTPRNESVRKKLAILYFGKGDTRKAYELLQAGIELNNDSESLRLGLSKLLIKADQAEAALSPLVHLPPKASKDYLAMRAVLSQKSQQEEIALESYQQLVNIDDSNARWWLGLGIQQERQIDLKQAKHSYQQALKRVGISSQSQNFVRDRLKILKELEGADSAN